MHLCISVTFRALPESEMRDFFDIYDKKTVAIKTHLYITDSVQGFTRNWNFPFLGGIIIPYNI